MDWGQALMIGGMFAANIITVIMLYIHSDGKLEGFRSENQALLKAIHDEMKDFHGRLCAIEERAKR